MSIINILEMDGTNKSTVTLPAVFQTPYRPDVNSKTTIILILILFKDKVDILQQDRW